MPRDAFDCCEGTAVAALVAGVMGRVKHVHPQVKLPLARIGLHALRRFPIPTLCVAGIALVYWSATGARRNAGGARTSAIQQHTPLRSDFEDARGRTATHPKEIPFGGWRDILARVKSEIGSDHVTLVSAGLAMYALLAVFPGLAAAVAIYGLFASPATVVEHMQTFSDLLPPGTWELFSRQLQSVAGQAQSSLSFAALTGVLVALWSARSGMSSLMVATNIAYAEAEKRGFIKQTLLSLVFTLAAILGFLTVLALGVIVPLALKVLGTHEWVQWFVGALRWLALWLVAVLGLSVLYRYAPSRERARWRWVTWGSAIAATLWILISVAFAFYVGKFASYGKTYGALSGVVALLMWFYVSSFTVVLGAEINAEMERQTKRDTTDGPEVPMGQRRAFAADTLGPPSGAVKSADQKERSRGGPAIAESARR
jgi:membrane protein